MFDPLLFIQTYMTVVLGEVQDVRRVAEHRRRGLPKIEPAPVHFGDVRNELRLDSFRA